MHAFHRTNMVISVLMLLVSLVSFSCRSQIQKDGNNIVVVNSGVSTRMGIARELAIINSFSPAVIAIDFQFWEMKNSYTDSILISVLDSCKHLIMATEIEDYTGDEVNYSRLSGTLPEFLRNAKIGFTNATLEDDDVPTLKKISVSEQVNGLTMYHLGVRAAMEFDSLKTMAFIRKNERVVDVRFKGNEEVFTIFTHDDLLGGKVKAEDIQGKIVLFGYTGPYPGYEGPLLNQDRFFSPLNDRKEPLQPDMYGVIFIANIINQILSY